ncbi:MAG: phage portal protein [Sphingobium sp.]|uniref:phage portal protein n=1 Tax=Sphingobium sp. TaxID=1912891 RepID=UPI0029B47807|nr:phage portal protein [Sphingobium sp.]MDX3908893.1 phage portal protein [Sphingobium sp.]
MRIAFEFSRDGSAEHRSLENPAIPLSSNSDELLQLLGVMSGNKDLPVVTIETALEVPAVFDAVGFLSRTLASLPIHAFRNADGEMKRSGGDLQMLLNEAPNPEWSSYDWRKYMWWTCNGFVPVTYLIMPPWLRTRVG